MVEVPSYPHTHSNRNGFSFVDFFTPNRRRPPPQKKKNIKESRDAPSGNDRLCSLFSFYPISSAQRGKTSHLGTDGDVESNFPPAELHVISAALPGNEANKRRSVSRKEKKEKKEKKTKKEPGTCCWWYLLPECGLRMERWRREGTKKSERKWKDRNRLEEEEAKKTNRWRPVNRLVLNFT